MCYTPSEFWRNISLGTNSHNCCSSLECADKQDEASQCQKDAAKGICTSDVVKDMHVRCAASCGYCIDGTGKGKKTNSEIEHVQTMCRVKSSQGC